MQDSGRDQAQDGFLAADHQCVAGIVAALETHHGLGVIRQPVNNLALAFVAPLGADHDNILGHVVTFQTDFRIYGWAGAASRLWPSSRQTSSRSQCRSAAVSPR